MQFRWIDWNREHIAEHGVDEEEAEMVVRNAKAPFPEEIEDEKLIVKGWGIGGRFLQVIYLLDPDGPLSSLMPGLLPNEKRTSCEGGGENEKQEALEALLGNDHGRAPRSDEAI